MQTCLRHGEETRVSCSSCGDPICPRCMVDSAVGMKCPACAAQPASVTRAVRRGWVKAAGAGLLTGVVLGVLFAILRLALFRGFLTGLGVSEAVLRTGRGQTGGPFLGGGLAGAVAGELAWLAVTGLPLSRFVNLGLLIAVAVVYFRLR